MKFYLVDVKNITSDTLRSTFAEADLDNLADIILESGGVIKPLILKHLDLENYTVVDGHFEYYAAVRAREKDPRKGEMVNAFVISPTSENTVLKQVAAFNAVESSSQPIKPLPDQTNLESRLVNIESRLERQINDLRAEQSQIKQSLDEKFKTVEGRITQRFEPLKLLNTLSKDELAVRLQRSRISGAEKIATAIVDARKKKQNQEFEGYRDLKESVKGLGEKTLLTIIDDWSRS